MKYWQLFWKFRKIHLMKSLEYRANFIFWSVITTSWALFNIFFTDLLIQSGGSEIGGWSRDQIFTIVGTFTIIDGFMWSFMYHNMSEYSRLVFEGHLSNLMVMPINLQFMLMTRINSYTNFFRVLLGVIIVTRSVFKLNLQPNLFEVGMYTLTLIVSILFIYFLWFILTTFSFWTHRLNNINELLPNLQRLWRFPRTIFIGFSSTIFTVLLPLGLVGSLPAEVLLGYNVYPWVVYFGLFAIGLGFISQKFLQFSIKKYSSVGG
jgi:ABC-2 type transport system permease protein